MSIPPSVGFGTITGVTLRTSDGSPVAGVQFIFTPALQPGLVTVAGSVPPVVIAVDPVVGVTNSAGVLCRPGGIPGVVLTASSDVDVSPSGWTWVVTTPGTSRWPSTAASFVLAPGEVKDLTTITTLSPSLGVEIAAWTAAIAAVTVLRDQAAAAATTAANAAVAGKIDTTAVDAKVAADIAAPASATRTALQSGYAPRSDVGREALEESKSRALFAWHAAASARNADILIIGDSKTEGRGASNVAARWIDRLATRLGATLGTTGRSVYFPCWYGSTFGTPPTFWVANGAVVNGQQGGLGSRLTELNASGESMTLSFTGTRVRLFFTRQNRSNDNVEILVDGVQVVASLNVTGTSGGPTTSGFTWLSSVLSNTAHTISVRWVSGAPYLDGAAVYQNDETSGVRLWDAAQNGYQAQFMSGGTANTLRWFGAVAPVAPALTVIAFGTNEHGSGARTPAQFKADVLLLIQNVRAQFARTSILLLGMNERIPSGISPVATYSQYISALFEIAAEDVLGAAGGSGVTVLDLTRRLAIGSSPDVYALHTDGIHFTDNGNAFVSESLLGFLTSA